jgi:hypothetical protein
MNRRARDILVLLSLACCALSLALWIATSGRPPRTRRLNADPAEARFLICGAGGLYFVSQEVSQSTDGSWTARITDYGDVEVRFSSSIATGMMYPASYGLGIGQRRVFRFNLYAGPGANAGCSIIYRAIGLPFWLMATMAAVPPAAWLIGHHRHRRRQARQGVCRRCGYDLRATPGRCPECGLAT